MIDKRGQTPLPCQEEAVMESTSLVSLPRLELVSVETLPSKSRRELAARREQRQLTEKHRASTVGLTLLSGVFALIYGGFLFFSWWHLFPTIVSGLMFLACLAATYIMGTESVRLRRSLQTETVSPKLELRASAENALCVMAIDANRYVSNWNNAVAHVETLNEPDQELLGTLRNHRTLLEAKQQQLRRLAERLERINKTS
jgi:hypothetical protein